MGDRKSPFPRFPEDYAPLTPLPKPPSVVALEEPLAMMKQMFELLKQQSEEREAERQRAVVAALPFTLLPPRGQA